jgi:hypothetical protein
VLRERKGLAVPSLQGRDLEIGVKHNFLIILLIVYENSFEIQQLLSLAPET